MFELLPLDDATLRFDPHWMAAEEADALFRDLQASIAWQVHRIHLFGREIDSPRLSCWIGDPGANYAYSGTRFAPQPWPLALQGVRERISASAGESFNSMLANLYRDGNDAMGWHSDDERELGARPTIASLSLGGSRRFVLKQRRASGAKLELELPNGSLLLMSGDTQRNYRHALPRTRRPVAARINLTFRRIHAVV